MGKVRQRAEFAGCRGRGVLANVWVGLLGWEDKEIFPETTVMEEECSFHLSVSSVSFVTGFIPLSIVTTKVYLCGHIYQNFLPF